MLTPALPRPARRGSMHVAAWQRQRLGHLDRIAIMDAARRLERRSHEPRMHGGALRRTGLVVLWNILYRGRSAAGVHDPALSQIAEWAGCARSTVQEAVKRLEAAGIMGHVLRGVVVRVRGVSRFCQWTSAYLFRAPVLWAPGSDTGSRQAIGSKSKKKLGREEEPAAPKLAEADRAALAAKWGIEISMSDNAPVECRAYPIMHRKIA